VESKKIFKERNPYFLAGDLGFTAKSELGILRRNISEIERMLAALIASLKNRPLSPLLQLNRRRTIIKI
jgi:hypothetical protein